MIKSERVQARMSWRQDLKAAIKRGTIKKQYFSNVLHGKMGDNTEKIRCQQYWKLVMRGDASSYLDCYGKLKVYKC